MRPRRHMPSLKRVLVETLVQVVVILVVFMWTNIVLAIIAALVTMFWLRSTRPKPDEGPPTGRDRL